MPIHYQAWVCPRVSWGCASSSRSWPVSAGHTSLWGAKTTSTDSCQFKGAVALRLSKVALSVSPTEEPHFHHLYSFFWSSPTARNHRWGQECRMNTFIHNLHSSTIWSSFSILLKCLSEFFVYGTWFCSCRTFHVWTGKLLIGAQILFPSNLILFQEFFFQRFIVLQCNVLQAQHVQ